MNRSIRVSGGLAGFVGRQAKLFSAITLLGALGTVGIWMAGSSSTIAAPEQSAAPLHAQTADGAPTQPVGKHSNPIPKDDDALRRMTFEDLAATLDGIMQSDLPKEKRSILENQIFWILRKKNPEAALKRFFDTWKDDDAKRFHLPLALQDWAMKEPKRAEAWLDAKLAENKIPDHRSAFEAALLSALAVFDPDAACKRLASLPPALRKPTLTDISFEDKPPRSQQALARTLAENLTDKSLRAECLKRIPRNSVTQPGDAPGHEAPPREKAPQSEEP